MQFAMILNGCDAPTPAPRIPAILCQQGETGVLDVATGKRWRPCLESARLAFPAKIWRKASGNPIALELDSGARLTGGRCSPSLPYATIRDSARRYVATAYFAPLSRESVEAPTA